MEPQTFLYIIGNVLFILGTVLAKSRIESWLTVLGAGVWQIALLVFYAIGINCVVTGGCDRYAWAVAIMLGIAGTVAFLFGLYSIATSSNSRADKHRRRN